MKLHSNRWKIKMRLVKQMIAKKNQDYYGLSGNDPRGEIPK